MTWNIQIKGTEQLNNKIDPSKYDKAIRTTMTLAVKGVKEYAQSIAPYKTGTLRRSIQFQVLNNGLQGIVYQDANIASYGGYVEMGTRAHEITPINKRALFWPGADHPMKSVQHPGTKPQPYMQPAYEGKKDWVLQTFNDAIKNLLGGR